MTAVLPLRSAGAHARDASGNAIPYGIQSSQLYGFGSSINAATNIELQSR